jgi:hypothetical protein
LFQYYTVHAQANNINTNETQVFATDSKPYGLTYSEWTGKWWQWAYSVPKNVNPSYDDSGRYCSEGQNGPVWFLTGSYKHKVDRYCNIPADKSVLFTIFNSECSFAEFPNLKTEQDLRKCAKEMQDSVIQVQTIVDGVNVKGLDKYRIQSQLFNFTLGRNNILGLPVLTTQAVSAGNWVFLKKLPVGNHVIYFKGGGRRHESVLSYRLTKTVSFSPDERVLKRKYSLFTYPGQSTRVNLPP